jgi:hypothetical protein
VANFLLIDAATQIIQCGLIDSKGKILRVLHDSGNVVEVLPNLISEICVSKFDDKLGIVYCYGPGSTLGLRLTVTAINVWTKFHRAELKLYRYSSLSMAKYLTGAGVVVYCGFGKFLAETPNGEVIAADSLDGYRENFCFLNTRRVAPKEVLAMNFVDYNLENFDGNIFETACEVKAFDALEMKDGGHDFVKWLPQRHAKLDV